MIKKQLLSILLLALTTICQANTTINSEFYTGKRLGVVTVGQKISLTIGKDITIQTDFESFLESFNTTYFSPGKIYYGTGIQYKQLGIMHYCLHSIDQAQTNTFPIRNKIYFQW